MHRVLIIGTGSIGERHLRCFLATGRAVVGTVELKDELRKAVAASYDVKEVFSSLDEALCSKWDAAVIATPACSHIPIALRMAEAGVNLYIEKPLSTTLDGIENLLTKVKEKNLLVGVAYVYRAHPVLAAMRKAIQGGRFGAPLQLVAFCGQDFPFYRPAYRDTYYSDRSKGGGAIQDGLTHIFNVGEWFVGPIDKLCADASHQFIEGVEVEDTVHVLTRQAGVCGCYSLNQYQAPNETVITVVCERGTLRCEMHKQRWGWMDAPEGDWHFEEFDIKDRDDWFTMQENAFLDAIEGKFEPLCTLEEAIQTLKVNLTALESADEMAGWKKVE